MLYKINKSKLSKVDEYKFSNEKELQKMCEVNLEEILNLKFIATEFSVGNLRLDTVAYDSETNSFVIIEYKNTKNGSVIDQGYTYLSAMFVHKADFVLEYNSVTDNKCKINEFDWTSSKVIFISPTFTKFQMQSINFKDLPIELWKIKKYSNDIILLEEIKPVDSSASVRSIAPKLSNDIKFDEIIVESYTEDDSLKNVSDNIENLYSEIKDFILDLDDRVALKPLKHYIAFKIERKTVISLKVQRSSILIYLNTDCSQIIDPKKICRDVTNVGHHGCGNTEIKIENKNNIGYIQDIIRAYLEDSK